MSAQRAWAVSMLKKYFEVTGKTQVGKRRFHYWLVSLPESERMIPAKKKGEFRPYKHTQSEYQNIACGQIADALLAGEIPWDCIVDEKNEEIFESAFTVEGSISTCILMFPIYHIYIYHRSHLSRN